MPPPTPPKKPPSTPHHTAALLHHLTLTGSHYDLLLPPLIALHTPANRLSTFRCQHPSSLWSPHRRLTLTPLPAHRAHYLTYQGPIGQNRGRVRRVDQGAARILNQSHHHATLTLHFKHFQGHLHLRRLTPTRWIATFTHPAPPFLLSSSVSTL